MTDHTIEPVKASLHWTLTPISEEFAVGAAETKWTNRAKVKAIYASFYNDVQGMINRAYDVGRRDREESRVIASRLAAPQQDDIRISISIDGKEHRVLVEWKHYVKAVEARSPDEALRMASEVVKGWYDDETYLRRRQETRA